MYELMSGDISIHTYSVCFHIRSFTHYAWTLMFRHIVNRHTPSIYTVCMGVDARGHQDIRPHVKSKLLNDIPKHDWGMIWCK
jgi:hypothetical protein